MKPKLFAAVVLLVIIFSRFGPRLEAQQPSTPATQPGLTNMSKNATPEERIAALQLEMTNAFKRVLQIVNQPVRAFRRTPQMRVSSYSPGWFHPGATKPDFNTVDVRQTQELIYAKNQYVTSDLNPGMVFLGQELEFNAMTKYFYTNRSLPKHRLTEAEMLEINQLYRVIGRCENELGRLQASAADATLEPAAAARSGPGTPVPTGPVERIRSIPKQTRVLYGGIAIVALILLVSVLRLAKRRTG